MVSCRYAIAILYLLSGIRLVSLAAQSTFEGPCSQAASPDQQRHYTAFSGSSNIAVFATETWNVIKAILLPACPTGIAADRNTLLVTTEGRENAVLFITEVDGKLTHRIPLGMGPCSPVLDAAGRYLYVCERFENQVAVIDVPSARLVTRISVSREPVKAALTPDQTKLLVANLLPGGKTIPELSFSHVSVIDTASHQWITNLALCDGAVNLRDIAISPEGTIAYAVHTIARFRVPTTQVQHGWMNAAGLSLIDLSKMKLMGTVLLDDFESGAANPWSVAVADQGKTIVVSHAGTHELSLIQTGGLMEYFQGQAPDRALYDFNLLKGLRKRVASHGNGPRSLFLIKNQVMVANHFSDSLVLLNLETGDRRMVMPNSSGEFDAERQGEMFFNDASYCFEQWQSCATCHPDGRSDALTWDLLNDGIGNPRNTKSLLFSHRTPPVMSTGVRSTAESAVRSGFRHIQFVRFEETKAQAIDAYLKSLRPVASPSLRSGRFKKSIERGRSLFDSREVGCAKCHPPGLFTDQQSHEVGTGRSMTGKRESFDTPSLVECWRTAPYLHHGAARSIMDVLTQFNKGDRHGRTSHLSAEQLEDLVHYLLTL